MFEDDDFFELNEELLAATEYSFVEANPDEDANKTVCFNCSGSDSTKSVFDRNSFMKNYPLGNVHSPMKNQSRSKTLFEMNISWESLTNMKTLSVLFNKARVNIQLLDASANQNSIQISNKTSFNLRLEITEFLTTIQQLYLRNILNWDHIANGLHSLRILMGSVEALPIINVISSANSTKGNSSASPVYHFLHGNLEWRWLHLRILLNAELSKDQFNDTESSLNTNLELHLRLIITDLIKLSICKYNKLKATDLLYSTSFSCVCIKELWLMTQILVEKLNETNKLATFWFYFNSELNQLRNGNNSYQSFDANRIVRKSLENVIPNDWIQFSIWLLCGVAKLHGFSENGQWNGSSSLRIKENYEQLDILAKAVLQTGPSEEKLRINLFLIAPLITEWWPAQTDTLMTFWEHFHGKLNSVFFVAGSAPDALAVVITSVVQYLEHIKSKLTSSTINPNETSFNIFVNLLGKVLLRLRVTEGSNQVRKVFGRITSKFSTTKLLALNETGLNNIVSLFTTLAVSTELAELAPRIQNFLLQVPLSRLSTSRQAAIVRGHIALLLIFLEQQLECSNFITKMLEQLNAAHLDDGYLACLKILAEGFREIYSTSQNFDNGELLLLDPWIVKYLSMSLRADEKLLECLNSTLIKLSTILNSITNLDSSESNKFQLLLDSFYKHLLPYVKQAFHNKEISNCIPEMAANFCICAQYTSKGVAYQFDDLFKYFAEVPCKNIQITIEFLVLILSTDKISSTDETLIVSYWIRCNLCATSNNKSLKTLTNIVFSLDEFHKICDAESSDILSSSEPLCEFFAEIGKLYQQTTDFNRKSWMIEKVHTYLASFDKYVSILEPDDLKVLSMIGIIIFHCAPLVYVRAKASCFFNVAICQYVMPTDVLMEKEPKEQKTKAVHKIWNLLINGIEKLDFKNDLHVNKILINLIVKWLPNFKIFTNRNVLAKPFVLCIKENTEAMAKFVFEKIASTFLALQRRFADKNVILTLNILTEVFSSVSHSEEKLKILLQTTLMNLIEHSMMVDDNSHSKPMIFELLKQIFTGHIFCSSSTLKQLTSDIFRAITTKHLSYYSSFYFQFMSKIIKINVTIVQNVMDHLKNQMNVVEQMRGMGRDAKLRSEYDKLEGALIAYSKSNISVNI